MKTALYLVVVATIATVIQGDITGTSPERNSCFCFNDGGLNILSSACGAVIGFVTSGQCFRYSGEKSSCNLVGLDYEFFKISWNGKRGWTAGVYLDQGSESHCAGSSLSESKSQFELDELISSIKNARIQLSDSSESGGSTGAGEYSCEVTDLGKRIQETLSSTPYDCKDSSCRNTCRGGQCVAYVTCKCKRNGRNVPNTSCWRQGRKVKTSDGKCNREIAPNTAIATFGSNGRYSEHAAVFIQCIDDSAVKVYDQWCSRGVGYSTYPSTHPFFNAFATITTNPDCVDRSSWPCRVEDSGPTTCPASQPKC